MAPQACGVKRNSCYYWLVTIKRNAMEFTSIKDIGRVLFNLKENMTNVGAEWSDNVGYELDSRSRLHLHTYISASRRIYFPRYALKGWSIHFKEVNKDAIPDVISYILKGVQHPAYLEQLELESYYYNLHHSGIM